jgi:hypothetical protein
VFSVERRVREESGRRRRKKRVCELRVFLIFNLLWFCWRRRKKRGGKSTKKRKKIVTCLPNFSTKDVAKRLHSHPPLDESPLPSIPSANYHAISGEETTIRLRELSLSLSHTHSLTHTHLAKHEILIQVDV